MYKVKTLIYLNLFPTRAEEIFNRKVYPVYRDIMILDFNHRKTFFFF